MTSQMERATKARKRQREEAYILLGERRNGLWLARAHWRTRGEPASVSFDWQRVLSREESHGDVVGFLHTHPGFTPEPSRRDELTMNAWTACFGKPLICAIASADDVRAWIYFPDGSPAMKAPQITRFQNGWIVLLEE